MEDVLSEFLLGYYKKNYNDNLKNYLKLINSAKSNIDFHQKLFSHKEFSEFKEECKIVKKIISAMLGDNWERIREQEGIEIHTMKNNEEFFIKVQCKIECEATLLLSICYETDLLVNWVSSLKKSTTLDEISMYRKKIHYEYNLPWPLTNRQSHLNVSCIPQPELNTVLLVVYSPKTIIKSTNDDSLIEMILPCCGVWIKKNSTSTDLVVTMQANKYIAKIPNWIVNYIIKSSFFQLACALKYHVENFRGSPYEFIVKDKKEKFYKEIQEVFTNRL
ncbi:hypothetical protein SteCoe_13236 [Stentor coeruleus]|uniref:START domain-containing protein n=1 Tax=Stentor coeruleus TaxID=5963 RepID=A0A1R2C8Z3_9CILI|nr:hypothetical protein SteCoe_13236 [Stentor coeruleus]